MILKDYAFAIINNLVIATSEDIVEAYQFISDNGYEEELSPRQFLVLRELVESAKVRTPVLHVMLP